ncbi:hypothetical protein B4V02_07295 [Paenibacillus kribbensis]|uniref:DUF4435 domain-containing protein n=1 Tax=Paenibacillus kribbensis TaxID=172713 RepID=A0A222WJ87_9BACL|nr:DUF4435 domain-containing protein [Paenibacillus kribbensis]ASR46497.1 hypothetical protein B4V02_07295 [Paenibacillus kribbensis]
MKYNIDEALVAARMASVPLVVVEGHDDIQFYENLLMDLNKEADVLAIDTFENYAEGCDSVIKAVEHVQQQITDNPDLFNYFLGIIDRDARYFRDEIPVDLKGLLVLKYYSFESHLIADHNIKSILPLITSINQSVLTSEIISFLKSGFNDIKQELYYLSLEALKNACVKDYTSILGYSESEGKIADNNSRRYLYNEVVIKKRELDDFADGFGLNINKLRLIVKGKWLLQAFSNSILEKINELPIFCFQHAQKKCQYCASGQSNKCLWKTREKYRYNQIANLMMSSYDENEVSYIRSRLNMLGNIGEGEMERQVS